MRIWDLPLRASLYFKGGLSTNSIGAGLHLIVPPNSEETEDPLLGCVTDPLET